MTFEQMYATYLYELYCGDEDKDTDTDKDEDRDEDRDEDDDNDDDRDDDESEEQEDEEEGEDDEVAEEPKVGSKNYFVVKAKHPIVHSPEGDDPQANASSQTGDDEWVDIGPGNFDDKRDPVGKASSRKR